MRINIKTLKKINNFILKNFHIIWLVFMVTVVCIGFDALEEADKIKRELRTISYNIKGGYY